MTLLTGGSIDCMHTMGTLVCLIPSRALSSPSSSVTAPQTFSQRCGYKCHGNLNQLKRHRRSGRRCKLLGGNGLGYEKANLCQPLFCASNLSGVVTNEVVESSTIRASLKDDPPTFITAPGKIVAIGDLHGDLTKTINSLEVAGVLRQDKNGWPVWCGDNTTVVQLGDVLDRGDCEIGILMLLRDLGHQAEKKGGAVYMINGNHESLNVCGNFRYVTRGAFYESALAAGLTGDSSLNWDEQLEARLALYSPGGLVARELAKNPTVLVVNDTVFAHGGLLPIHVNYGLERINHEVAAWMRGDILETGNKATPPFIAMGGSNSIMWNRTLGQESFNTPYDKFYACSLVKTVLKKLKSKRLVVGHTPQLAGCNCECQGQIWRVDVGMSNGVLNAPPQALIIDSQIDGSTNIDVVEASSSQPMIHQSDFFTSLDVATPFPEKPKSTPITIDVAEKVVGDLVQMKKDRFDMILQRYLKNDRQSN